MAKYENEGFCPNNSFNFYEGEKSSKAQEIMKGLGSRPAFMVYDENGTLYQPTSIVDVILGGDGFLGEQVMRVLSELIPKCEYPSIGKKILIKDVLSRHTLTQERIFADERYFIGVEEREDVVTLYIYKKAV